MTDEQQTKRPPKDLQNPAVCVDELGKLEDWVDQVEELWPELIADVKDKKAKLAECIELEKAKLADLMLAAPADFTVPMKDAWVTKKLAESEETEARREAQKALVEAEKAELKLDKTRKLKDARMEMIRSALSWHKEQLRQQGFGHGQRNPAPS